MFSKNIPDDNKEQSELNYVRSKMPEIIDKLNLSCHRVIYISVLKRE
jgi:hypothetical protein